jgi:hypothetical protein
LNYDTIGNILKTDNFIINFDYIIADVKYLDGIFVVLLSIPNEVNETDNIYGIDLNGDKIWKIENPIKAFNVNKYEQGYNYLALSTYTLTHLSQNGIFTATTFFAMKYTFDHKTGKLTKSESTRW